MNAVEEIKNLINLVESGYYNGAEFRKKLSVYYDVEPVVRCKDCIHLVPSEIGGDSAVYGCSVIWSCAKSRRTVTPNFFCADGEKASGKNE